MHKYFIIFVAKYFTIIFNLKSSEDDYTDALFYPKPSDSSIFTLNIERKLKNPYKSNGSSIPRSLPPPPIQYRILCILLLYLSTSIFLSTVH